MTYIDEMIKELCPDGVEWKELGEVCELKNGYTPSKSNNEFWENGDVPWFRLEDIRKNGRVLSDAIQHVTNEAVKKELFPANSLIISTTATIGEVALVTVPFLCNQQITAITPIKKYANLLDVKFLFHYMQILSTEMKRGINEGSFPIISLSKMKGFQIPLPPREIQEEIVKILDKFTEYVTELTAELTFRQKQYEYYREAIIGFKTQKHQFVRLSDIASYSKEKIANTHILKGNYIGVENLLQNKRGFVKKELELAPGNSTMFSPGSTLIGNIRPYLKKILYAEFFGGTNGDVLVVDILDSCKEFVDSKYLYYCLSSDYFFNFMNQNSRGAKMPRGDKNKIMEFELPLPSLEEQKQIVMILDKFESLVYSIQDGLPKLIEEQQKQYAYYRQNLLSFGEMEGK